MTAPTTERAFEDAIAAHLTSHGWRLGDASTFDPVRGVFAEEFVAWVRESQPEAWEALTRLHGDGGVAVRLVEALVAARALRKTPELLRKGFDLSGTHIDVAVFPPSQGRNAEVLRRVAAGRLTVTRQVRFDPAGSDSVDLVLSLNGVPVATAEIKVRTTGGHWQRAVEQYCARPTGVALFRFAAGPVVHFAVDTEEVWMTTELAKEGTRFVPFNRGNGALGGGNPVHPAGARTSYLWHEVWARDTWLEALGRFVQYVPEERSRGKVRPAEVVFPRYHQFSVVRRLVAAVREEGAGGAYLVQHSAGSGKSKTIAWLALRLANLHDLRDARLFDAVLIITDRTVLDDQLTDELRRFSHERDMVQDVDGAKALHEALTAMKARIFLVTVQTFPYVAEALAGAASRRFALVIDEAHSSQRGTSAEAMYRLLGMDPPAVIDDAPELDADAVALAAARAMAEARQRASVSVFAFTATPRDETKVAFGQVFDLYSMRQAIEENFIRDVLEHYVTFDAYFRLVQLTTDDPEVDRRRAAAALARRISLDPKSIEAKSHCIADHFLQRVKAEAKGRAKAMVVAPSRLLAVRYTQALRTRFAAHGATDVGVFVAFSGKVIDAKTKEEFTEEGVNHGVSEKALPGRFDRDDARILVVANKYQTGFDQPLLVAMYVDRALSGIQAVQTLSRLNRVHRDKAGTFVLDFVNDEADIVRAFRQYHGAASVVTAPSPEELARLKARLDSAGVYEAGDLRAWLAAYVAGGEAHARQSAMLAALGAPVDRAKALPEAQRATFRGELETFVRMYELLAHALATPDAEAETLHGFGRMLLDLLAEGRARAPLPDLSRRTALVDYRITPRFEGSLSLVADGGATDGDDGAVIGTASGRRPADSRARLSEVLASLHARFGLPHDPEVEAMLQGVLAEAAAHEPTRTSALGNDAENFVRARANRDRLRRGLQLRTDDGLAERFVPTHESLDALVTAMLQTLYEVVRAASPEGGDGEVLDAASRVRLAQVNERRNALEPRLRRFVRRVLTEALGPERWIDPVLALLPTAVRKQLEGVAPEEVLAKRLLLSNVIAVIDAHWGQWFAPALEGGRASGERVTRAQVAVLLEHVNAHREDAHARSLTDAEYASVTVAIEQMLRVLGEAERGA